MLDQVKRVALDLVQAIGSPLAIEAERLIRLEDWTALQKLRTEASIYTDAEDLWGDNLVVDFLRKCDLPSSVDKERVAVDTFWACEAQCASTNARLWVYLPENDLYWPSHKQAHIAKFIAGMRKDISTALRRLPDTLTPLFSGGATMSDKGTKTTVPDKLLSVPSLYEGTKCLSHILYETSWGDVLRRHEVVPTVVRGNSFFTVPKDAEKRRGCAKEASVNVTLQLAAAQELRKALRRWGIDLEVGQARHRRIAYESSLFGHRATIDMSNASDTVSRVAVSCLIREDWLMLLNSLRATHTRVGKKWVFLEKFSSMGNGFTFELETLIFCALGREAHRTLGLDPDDVSCFGDDLIVDSSAARLVMAVLRFLGFEPNMKKSFVEGPFRESCGGDYFRGVPVRGFYLKELPDKPADWISIANGLRRTCAGIESRWDLVRKAWFRVLSYIPSDIRRCRGPSHLGDIVIHDDEALWTTKTDPNGTVFVRTFTPVPFRVSLERWPEAVQLASCTLVSGEDITPRGRVSGYRHRWVPAYLTSSWLPLVGTSG